MSAAFLSDDVMNLLTKGGLVIGLFFSVSPVPALLKAVTSKDKDALKSLSIPGALMGLSCSTSILAFCEMEGLTDCVTSCWMFLSSAALSLLVYTALNSMFLTLTFITASQFALYYSVYNLFTPETTQLVNFVLNFLACVLMPLD